MNVVQLEEDLNRIFALGQRYWQSLGNEKKSDKAMEEFREIVWRVCNRYIQETNQ